MESREQNSPAGEDAERTIAASRFNERAEEEARPVVPLRSVGHAGGTAEPARGPRVMFRPPRTARPRSLILALALAAGAVLGATVVFRGTRQAAPMTAPQTSVEATTDGVTGPAPTRPVQADISDAPTGEPRDTEVRDEPRGRDKSERRDGDNGKRAEHARKEEEHRRQDQEKRAERDRKEAEKQGERLRRALEKRARREAKRVGIIIGES